MRNGMEAMALQLYKGQNFTFVNGNEFEADQNTNPLKVIRQLQPGDNVVHVDTKNGIAAMAPVPIDINRTAPTSMTVNGVTWTFPIAAAPVDLIMPAISEAAGKFYCIVMQCGSEDCNVYDKETGTVLFNSNTTGETILLYCNGYGWYDMTMARLVP